MLWYFCTLEIYSLALNLSIMSYQLGLLSNPQRLKVCCTLVATYKAAYLGTQLVFGIFALWRLYSLALILSIMSHLSNSQRLKVCCSLVVTLEVTYLGTKLLVLVFSHSGGLLLSTQPEYHESPK